MDYKQIYEEWLSNPYFDEATKEELRSIKDDDKEIKERFYKDLEFGTAGLRGVIGAGVNRMNIYVVRRATQGSLLITLSSRADRIRRCHCLRFPPDVPGVCRGSSSDTGSKWN